MGLNQVIYPPHIKDPQGEVIFLAGPIQGAVNWQEEAIKILSEEDDFIALIACPRRMEFNELCLAKHQEQIDWETYYLRKAGRSGVVMFWLAKESTHDCSRSFAQTSRFELGEWKVRREIYGVNLVVGIEPGFSNETYIRHRLGHDCPSVKIYSTLLETCQQTINILREERRVSLEDV